MQSAAELFAWTHKWNLLCKFAFRCGEINRAATKSAKGDFAAAKRDRRCHEKEHNGVPTWRHAFPILLLWRLCVAFGFADDERSSPRGTDVSCRAVRDGGRDLLHLESERSSTRRDSWCDEKDFNAVHISHQAFSISVLWLLCILSDLAAAEWRFPKSSNLSRRAMRDGHRWLLQLESELSGSYG